MLQSPFQVGMHIIIAVIFSQVNQHSCGAATVSGPTEAAVADPSAWRALPLLPETMKSVRLAQHTHTHTSQSAAFRCSPDSAERLGPPLHSGCEDRGHRTDPSPPRTLDYGSLFWCRLFFGGTGGKWIPDDENNFYLKLKKKNVPAQVFSSSQ